MQEVKNGNKNQVNPTGGPTSTSETMDPLNYDFIDLTSKCHISMWSPNVTCCQVTDVQSTGDDILWNVSARWLVFNNVSQQKIRRLVYQVVWFLMCASHPKLLTRGTRTEISTVTCYPPVALTLSSWERSPTNLLHYIIVASVTLIWLLIYLHFLCV